jgi:hypothetical protein
MPGEARTRTVGERTLAVAAAYGYGLTSLADPELGRVLGHSGGLPGFGSNVIFSPDAGIGVFAFANVTYAGPEPTNMEAASRLFARGLWRPRPIPVSRALEAAARAIAEAYAAGDLALAQARFAPNLLADLPLADRNRALAEVRMLRGQGRLERIEPRHALAGRLHLACERGPVICDLALAPGVEHQIQALRFEG